MLGFGLAGIYLGSIGLGAIIPAANKVLLGVLGGIAGVIVGAWFAALLATQPLIFWGLIALLFGIFFG
jgi:hypothetical protein